MSNQKFKISLGDPGNRANTDKIYIPLTPNQINALIKKLEFLLTNDLCIDKESISSKPGTIHILIEAIKNWENIL